MAKLPFIDLAIIVFYMIGMLIFGYRLGISIRSDQDYFLGGKRLPWWAIGMSMVVSDIGALELVGLAGGAYLYGIAIGCLHRCGPMHRALYRQYTYTRYFTDAGRGMASSRHNRYFLG
ncbi:hypothetical protein JW935_04600 [candidate division KSB1 bacterium]|nr:hypothetical protein [candidate division KSB1 bacterium]